jgi:hypothetical protein
VTNNICRPSFCNCDTCSTVDAKRPMANPSSFSRVINAVPSLTIIRRASFISLRDEIEDLFESRIPF